MASNRKPSPPGAVLPLTLAELVAASGIAEKAKGAIRVLRTSELKAALAAHYGIGAK